MGTTSSRSTPAGTRRPWRGGSLAKDYATAAHRATTERERWEALGELAEELAAVRRDADADVSVSVSTVVGVLDAVPEMARWCVEGLGGERRRDAMVLLAELSRGAGNEGRVFAEVDAVAQALMPSLVEETDVVVLTSAVVVMRNLSSVWETRERMKVYFPQLVRIAKSPGVMRDSEIELECVSAMANIGRAPERLSDLQIEGVLNDLVEVLVRILHAGCNPQSKTKALQLVSLLPFAAAVQLGDTPGFVEALMGLVERKELLEHELLGMRALEWLVSVRPQHKSFTDSLRNTPGLVSLVIRVATDGGVLQCRLVAFELLKTLCLSPPSFALLLGPGECLLNLLVLHVDGASRRRLRVAAFSLLSCLATDAQCALAICKSRVITTALVEAVKDASDRELTLYAVATVARVTKAKHSAGRLLQRHPDLVSALAQIAKRPNYGQGETLHIHAFLALAHLATSRPLLLFRAAGLMQTAIAHTATLLRTVRASALHFLANVGEEHLAVQVALFDEPGLVEAVTSVLTDERLAFSECVANALRLLHALSRPYENKRSLMLIGGLVHALKREALGGWDHGRGTDRLAWSVMGTLALVRTNAQELASDVELMSELLIRVRDPRPRFSLLYWPLLVSVCEYLVEVPDVALSWAQKEENVDVGRSFLDVKVVAVDAKGDEESVLLRLMANVVVGRVTRLKQPKLALAGLSAEDVIKCAADLLEMVLIQRDARCDLELALSLIHI